MKDKKRSGILNRVLDTIGEHDDSGRCCSNIDVVGDLSDEYNVHEVQATIKSLEQRGRVESYRKRGLVYHTLASSGSG